MDHQTALKQFSKLLKLAAKTLSKVAATGSHFEEAEVHLIELDNIASRLHELGERLSHIATLNRP